MRQQYCASKQLTTVKLVPIVVLGERSLSSQRHQLVRCERVGSAADDSFDLVQGTTSPGGARTQKACFGPLLSQIERVTSFASRVSACRNRCVLTIFRLSTAALSGIGLLGCEADALDRQIAELCKRDGGTKVYETAVLPIGRFRGDGVVLLGQPKKIDGGLTVHELPEGYLITRNTEVLRSGDPFKILSDGKLTKMTTVISRSTDGKVLGQEVSYSRTGGDITFGHPSSNYCPRPNIDVLQEVFKREKA